MKNLHLAAAFVASLLVAPPAVAQFGMPAMPSAGGGGATAADVDRFVLGAAEANKLVADASTRLLEAVGSKAQVDAYQAELKAANATVDPQERDAKLKKAEENKNAVLAAVDYGAKTQEKIKQASAAQKAAVGASIYNLSLGALKDADLVLTGKKMVSGVPDPSIASRLASVKDTITALSSQGESLTKIVGSAKTLMSSVGLEALPTKASDAPKSTGGI
jgi:hypothetical protein